MQMIRQQAIILSLMGIPLGLVGGWLAGAALTPIIIAQLDGIVNTVSARPLIFVMSALFALFTVLISCRRPGKMAAKVSPVEATKYTECVSVKKKRRSYAWGKGLSDGICQSGKKQKENSSCCDIPGTFGDTFEWTLFFCGWL